MELGPVDLSRLRDVDISPYGKHLAEYVSAIESRIGKPIRFLDIATHPIASKREHPTHTDIGWCESFFPAVWVNRRQMDGVRYPDYYLAHEATHVELLFQDYPFGIPDVPITRAEAEIRTRVASLAQDLVIEDRLADFGGFEGSHEFEDSLERFLCAEDEDTTYVPPHTKPEHRELLHGLRYAAHFLCRYCQRRHKRRLRKTCKRYHPIAWNYVQQIIAIVKNIPHILEPEGQARAIRQITVAFGLDKT